MRGELMPAIGARDTVSEDGEGAVVHRVRWWHRPYVTGQTECVMEFTSNTHAYAAPYVMHSAVRDAQTVAATCGDVPALLGEPVSRRRRTFNVEWDPDRLVHLVEARQLDDGGAWVTIMWCEGNTTLWADPPFTTRAASCLRCHAAQKPGRLVESDAPE